MQSSLALELANMMLGVELKAKPGDEVDLGFKEIDSADSADSFDHPVGRRPRFGSLSCWECTREIFSLATHAIRIAGAETL
jgi:hypothetical protein